MRFVVILISLMAASAAWWWVRRASDRGQAAWWVQALMRGAAIGIGANYYDIGRQAGALVVRILKGESPGAIAFQTSTVLEIQVNRSAAQKQGMPLSDDLLKSASNVIN